MDTQLIVAQKRSINNLITAVNCYNSEAPTSMQPDTVVVKIRMRNRNKFNYLPFAAELYSGYYLF